MGFTDGICPPWMTCIFGNVLLALATSAHPGAKTTLAEIGNAARRHETVAA
jgi:hypothetical protein